MRKARQSGAALISRVALCTVLLLPSVAHGSEETLEAGFKDPPTSARPLVWWHWMNGNVTADGIAKDIDWMSRIGLGGLQHFDVALKTAKLVEPPVIYMSDDWKALFHRAVDLADKKELEFGIAASPGWSETGGPWVPPRDGLKKLVWSEIAIEGGRAFKAKLPSPPTVTGPYANMKVGPSFLDALTDHPPFVAPTVYEDVRVLALPDTKMHALARPQAEGLVPADLDRLIDDDQGTGIDLVGGDDKPPQLRYFYGGKVTIRSATLYMPGAVSLFAPSAILPLLEASDDGQSWRPITAIEPSAVPTTVSFAPVTAKYFRLVVAARPGRPAEVSGGVPGIVTGGYGTAKAGAPTYRVATFQLSPRATINQYEVKAGFGLARDYYILDQGTADGIQGINPDRVIDITKYVRADGLLDWTPPPGRWKILRLGWSLTGTTNHPATAEATGLEVDKFDAAAVRRYLQTYLGNYALAKPAGDRRGIDALVTDSIEVGAANWTPGLIEAFRSNRGYDPTPWLPALSGIIVGDRTRSDAFLYDFRRTLADLIVTGHYAQIASTAYEHGLRVYGEALELGRPSLGDDMAMRSHADVPMSAIWTFGKGEQPRSSHVADMKGASSVGHVYGRPIIAAESLTARNAPWAYGPADLKPVIDLAFSLGINRPVIHTSVHQPVDDKRPGLSLSVFGQYFTRHESWAEMAKPWIDYIARTGFLLQQGRNVADVAYFYGEEAPLTALYRDEPMKDAPRGYAFDFVNSDILLNAMSVSQGRLVTPGGASYGALYLGGTSSRMTLAVLRKIASFVDQGVILIGSAPVASPSLDEDREEYRALVQKLWPERSAPRVDEARVVSGLGIDAAMQSVGISPDLEVSDALAASKLAFVHRKLDEGDLYFISNRTDEPITADLSLRVTGYLPELWRAETGTTEPVSYRVENGRTHLSPIIGPGDAFFIMMRKPLQSQRLDLPNLDTVDVASIDGPWTLSFPRSLGAPDTAQFDHLTSLSENSDPAIRYFSGTTTYRSSFEISRELAADTTLRLDLGLVAELAEVRLNGVSLGTYWKPPFLVETRGALRAGLNSLEIRVANLWVNRLIGDAQRPVSDRISFTAVPTYRRDAPLRPSGLIGPVKLVRRIAHGSGSR